MEDNILARQMKAVLDQLMTPEQKRHLIDALQEEDIARWTKLIHKRGEAT